MEKTRREDFLHYVWKFSLFEKEGLVTNDGQPIRIVSHGTHNQDAGPDFVDARIHIGHTLWAGNVEIHHRASDWFRHGHGQDVAYDSVILHVVEHDDQQVRRTCGTLVPSLTLKFNTALLDNYEQLLRTKRWVFCDESIAGVPGLVKEAWLERMVVERLERKTSSIEASLAETSNDWAAAFYVALARSFGASVNADAFEALARSLPYACLAKHKSSLLQLEALLFGQAGMLEGSHGDEYPADLAREYSFLRNKFCLEPMDASAWKFMRMRPSNFPTIRIAQFARLLNTSSTLLSKIIETGTVGELKGFFNVTASPYWDTHYRFGKESKSARKHMGDVGAGTILVNTVIPFIFIYGKMNGQPTLQERAVEFLGRLPFEQNQVTSRWVGKVPGCDNAARSQALIHLEKQYCLGGRCLQCAIGSCVVRTLG